jgi:hypothetical protein
MSQAGSNSVIAEKCRLVERKELTGDGKGVAKIRDAIASKAGGK